VYSTLLFFTATQTCCSEVEDGLEFKSKVLNIFKLDLNWIQTKINLNKFFEGFSNRGLSKISLNIQIQNKALNRRLLK
jgi:hypothetical protein